MYGGQKGGREGHKGRCKNTEAGAESKDRIKKIERKKKKLLEKFDFSGNIAEGLIF